MLRRLASLYFHGRNAVAALKRDERGADMVEVLLSLLFLVFFSVYPVQIWMVDARHQLLENIESRYLLQMQIQGGLTPIIWSDLQADMQSDGFDPAKANFTGTSPLGQTITRGNEVSLYIGYPIGDVVTAPLLLGQTAWDPTQLQWATGIAVSEYP